MRPDAAPNLAPGEGVLIVATEADHQVALRMCVAGDRGRCAELGPTPRDGTLEVYALPEGRYCMVRVQCEERPGVTTQYDVPERDVRCIDVVAGQIAYGGHLIFDRSEGSAHVCAGRSDWILHDAIDAELAAEYPQLGGPRVTLSAPTPAEPGQ